VRPFVNRAFYRILYLPHRYIEKAFWFAVSAVNRLFDIARAARYDVVFIHREAYPFGGPFIESILHAMGKPIVFDFDDAIFLPNTSEENIYIERFKRPDKVEKIIRMSSQVIAGNSYLKTFALKYNKNVCVIPSCIDTEKYAPASGRCDKTSVTIGWVGSNTTKRFLYDLEEAFVEISNRYENILFKIVGAPFYSMRLGNVVSKEWSLEDDVKDIQSFDIGIMPLPDNEWTKGKCAYKALLYMACGIPVVASPVGMNTEVNEDGVDGFLASGPAEWVAKISRLIENEGLREKMGRLGREKVLKGYSVKTAAPVFYDVLMKAKGPR
jgi:glycosyltransferase involved in cell wall biosynthesis